MSEQPKWTPRPWTAAIDDDGRESSEIRAGGSLIANVYGSEDFPCLTDEETDAKPEEFAANARLIAAAPELYDALNWCVSLLADCKTEGVFTTAIEQGIRALAKARGDA